MDCVELQDSFVAGKTFTAKIYSALQDFAGSLRQSRHIRKVCNILHILYIYLTIMCFLSPENTHDS